MIEVWVKLDNKYNFAVLALSGCEGLMCGKSIMLAILFRE
jgi:hypothetical protein